MLWCNFRLCVSQILSKEKSLHTALPPHPHTLPDLPTETLRPLAHTHCRQPAVWAQALKSPTLIVLDSLRGSRRYVHISSLWRKAEKELGFSHTALHSLQGVGGHGEERPIQSPVKCQPPCLPHCLRYMSVYPSVWALPQQPGHFTPTHVSEAGATCLVSANFLCIFALRIRSLSSVCLLLC